MCFAMRLIETASIVAVHGLGGHWKYTWTHRCRKFWLRDFLPSQVPTARIMSYGYNSQTAFSKAVTDINDQAAMLLDRLDGERQSVDAGERPIIFISHSLGGILVKKVRHIAFLHGIVKLTVQGSYSCPRAI